MNARISAALAISLGLLVATAAAPQAAESPLVHFGGSWSGSGKIVVSNGSAERIRCRGTYKPADSGLSLTLRCASDSYKFELASDITYDAGSISGTWNETSRGVTGSIAGKATANHIEASAASVGFTASLTISLRGNSQTVVIRSPGSEISEVSVSLARAGR
jgi:hypothetical protein